MTMFSDGVKIEKEEYNKIVYPEALLDKKCGGCVRCEKRDHGKEGYHCCMQNYNIDIRPTDKACIHWWNKEEHLRIEKANKEAKENRRKELWGIYAKKEPIKLPIVNDGYGIIPKCPVCGEMPYSTEQCHWCGQKFVQDEEVEEYSKPKIIKGKCFGCGSDVDIRVSKYNGHKSYYCDKCGMSIMEQESGRKYI